MSVAKSDIGRFAIVPLWLIEATADGSAIRLFALLAAKYADRDTALAWPSRATLAADLGVSRDTIDRAIRDLKDAGALTVRPRYVSQRRRDSNIYALTFARPSGRMDAATPTRTRAATPSRTVAATPSRTVAAENQSQAELQSTDPEEPPQPPATLSRGALRAMNGSGRRRDQQALADERPDIGGPDARYFGGKYGAILRQRLEEGSST